MISVSFLKSKFSKKETLERISNSNADYLHVDLMDGEYTENKNFSIDKVVNDLKSIIKPLDIHLMVNNPLKYIDSLAKLKPDTITVHINIKDDLLEVINLIKDYNINVGIAINPDEDISILDKYVKYIDYVLIMSVYPGKGGQKFIQEVLTKIPYLYNKNVLIGIDGGINDETISLLKDYKVDRIISGSYVCMSDNYNESIEKLRNSL